MAIFDSNSQRIQIRSESESSPNLNSNSNLESNMIPNSKSNLKSPSSNSANRAEELSRIHLLESN